MARRSLALRVPARVAAVPLVLVVSLLCASAAHAVNVSGTIEANTTWTVAGVPHVLNGDR